MIIAPDETFTVAEAAAVLARSERQVLRYLESGRLRGSKASGRWMLTAFHIWEFQSIADAMMENWRIYCHLAQTEENKPLNQMVNSPGD